MTGRPPGFPLAGLIQVDPEDEHFLEKSWYAVETPYTTYAAREEEGITLLLHREIMQTCPGEVVDHLDKNGLNCTRANMRNCTQSDNILRAYPEGGVYKLGKRWKVQMGNKHLGMFDTEDQARAYRRAVWERRVG